MEATRETEQVAPGTGTTGMDATGAKKVKGRKRNVWIIAGTMAIDGGDSGLINSLFPVIQASLGLASSALGVLLSVGRMFGVITGPILVFLTKYFSRRTILAVAGGFWGAWSILAGFSQDFTQLLILYTIMVGGAMAGHVFLPTVVGDSFEDGKRARVIGWVYGALVGTGAVTAPLIGQLANIEDGWRYGFFIFGALNIVFGFLTLFFFRDPGIGSIDGRADGGQEGAKTERDLTLAKIKPLFRIRSFQILSLSRLISPHPVMASFGVIMLVQAHGLSVPVAATIMAPFGIGYLLGNILVGYLGDWFNRISPRYGRIGLLQFAQFAFGGFALLATQFTYENIAWYAVFFALMGSVQGWNPILNRPIVMGVVAPELRSAAFGFMISVVESVSFSLLALITGFLADAVGIQSALFWTVVVVVLANGVLLTALYPAYVRDKARLESQLHHNREEATS
ncbi:MFS transporter [Agromyces sp. GXS1127]|uniref:MFS transporter n=1 Tax=Agromyces sp. GXS1127 TaxID=3424181 RepID=UPI003D321E87